jgi:dimethylglycine dehydrogenase
MVHGVTDVDARGSEAIYKDGELVGRATSGGYGFRVEQSLALGLVKPELAAVGTELDIEILGSLYRATVLEESPYDPDNAKLRG